MAYLALNELTRSYWLSFLIILSVFMILLSAITYFVLAYRPLLPPQAPKTFHGGYPILGATQFFTERWSFWKHASAQSPTGNFSFNIGPHQIVGLTGDGARKMYFESKKLNLEKGYDVLFGAGPSLANSTNLEKSEDQNITGTYFNNRLLHMLRRGNFARSLPDMIGDTRSLLDSLVAPSSSVMDPFEDIYKLIYRLTMRTVGCAEIANDPALLDKTLGLFEDVSDSSTATTMTFPWLPSPPIIKRYVAGARLYTVFNSIVNERKRTGKRVDDPLQYLIDQGDSMDKIIGFVLGALFAGMINTGINAAWVLCYLANTPEWMTKVRQEIVSAAEKYTYDGSLHLVEKLSKLPLDAWENDFPMIDLCLRESIRFQLCGTSFRRNISGEDVPVGKEIIPNGAFALYHFDEVHHDPAIYTNPEKWDPSRYLPDRAEDKKKPHTYLGWGSGRHPCLGMKFAKLEVFVATALFLAAFDIELCDREGNLTDKLPYTDRNGHAAGKPNSHIYLKYRPRK